MQPPRSFLLRTFSLISFLLGVVALGAWWLGLAAGLAAALLILLGVWASHLRQLALLRAWAQAPLGTPVPAGYGLWADVFAALYQRSREQREQRQALTDTLERFRNLAQSLPDGVIVLGAQHEIEWLNTRAELHFGLTEDQDAGYPLTNLLRDESLVSFLDQPDYSESLLLRPLRSPGQVLSLQRVPFGADSMLLLSRDVSQIEKLETMRRDFVANVSHELKTPLTVIAGFVEMLRDGWDDMSSDEVKSYLQLADEQADRMRQLIEDLLTLATLETTALPTDDEVVDVAALLADVQGEAELLSSSRHQIRIERTGPARVFGSQKELRSAFGNLAVNAVRYTPAGGAVTLRWAPHADGGAVFSVQDTGVGIAAEHLPRLTERFYRVDRGRSRDMGGTGLGLAIVKHALERHQAHLDIRSEPGHGSTFSAVFPRQRIAA